MPRTGTKLNSGTLAADNTIAQGASITVYGIHLTNSAAIANVQIEDTLGNILFIIRLGSNSPIVLEVPFVASNGIVFKAVAATTGYTIIYSGSG